MKASRRAYDLLIACAVWNANENELQRVRDAARAGVDWSTWIGLVRWHRLVPHAQRAISQSGAGAPAEIRDALMAETRSIAAASLARAQQLVSLVRAMDRAGVAMLPFKGPALSLAAYGDVGVRDSIDLDIVVHERDVDRARAALAGEGYTSRSQMSPAQERMLQRSFGHFVYAAPAGGANVELHWRFASARYPWSLRAADVFARAVPLELSGCAMRAPDATDQLVLQAMHGARHQWERLEWLVAFSALLAQRNFSEQQLIERARTNRSACALSIALRLAHDLLGAPMTPRLAGESDGASVAVLASRIARAIGSGMDSSDPPYALNVRMMDGAGDRARYIARSVFTPTAREWELIRLPDALLFLYYPIRLARVAAMRLRSLFVRR